MTPSNCLRRNMGKDDVFWIKHCICLVLCLFLADVNIKKLMFPKNKNQLCHQLGGAVPSACRHTCSLYVRCAWVPGWGTFGRFHQRQVGCSAVATMGWLGPISLGGEAAQLANMGLDQNAVMNQQDLGRSQDLTYLCVY